MPRGEAALCPLLRPRPAGLMWGARGRWGDRDQREADELSGGRAKSLGVVPDST
jgi:hypothetical protein